MPPRARPSNDLRLKHRLLTIPGSREGGSCESGHRGLLIVGADSGHNAFALHWSFDRSSFDRLRPLRKLTVSIDRSARRGYAVDFLRFDFDSDAFAMFLIGCGCTVVLPRAWPSNSTSTLAAAAEGISVRRLGCVSVP